MTARVPYSVKPIDWNSPEADPARQIRLQVFVGEQKVPPALELDATDSIAVHLLACTPDGHPCGTGRLFPDPHAPGDAHIGRMAVVREARGTGCGSALLHALLDHARRQGYRRVTLSAQTHALPFYTRHGFTPEGPIYEEAGIPHQSMSLVL